MSEESATPPPALRLKPRLRPADGEASAAGRAVGDPTTFPPPAPVISVGLPVQGETSEAAPAPKIRLKPRMGGNSLEATEQPVQPAAASVSAIVEPPPPVIQPPTMANPPMTAPAPAPFVSPPAPPPLFVSDSPPPSASSVAADASKFKLKPKAPAVVTPPPSAPEGAGTPSSPPPAVAPVASNTVSPIAASTAPFGSKPPLPAPAPATKSPPPFPLVARPPAVPASAPAAGKEKPPVAPVVKPAGKKSPLLMVAGLAVVILGGGGFAAWKFLRPAKQTPPPAPMAKAVQPKAPPAPKSDPAPTPSDTLNKLAHAPANAINQAQDTIAARRASGQARIDAASVGEDLPEQPATPAAGAPAAKSAPRAATSSTATTTIAPNVVATTQLDAVPEAAAPFRSFVANAKVSGVFQGNPSRAVINGKLTRAGDVVDSTLGITFNGVDSERRHLVFKDKTGATVSRRY